MSDLTHLFKVGQAVRCRMDGEFHKGTVKETYTDYIVVDIPTVSEHCCFENGFNIGWVYPEYNFNESEEHLWSDAALERVEVCAPPMEER